MRLLTTLIFTGLTSMAVVPVYSADTASTVERLLVGKTNINCVQAPCPWRGIARQGDLRSGPAGLLWSEDDLPTLEANPEDASRIQAAWNENLCLLNHGRLIGATLHVERVAGACP